MTSHNRNLSPIGGYFELELPSQCDSFHQNAINFQSARAAFYSVLQKVRPQRVWMPRYICDAMFEPLTKAGVETTLYDLDLKFEISSDVQLGKKDLLLYVNYFGINDAKVDAILQRFSVEQIILDFAQSFYSHPRKVLATIYSPRKFFGIPDGGLLITDLSIQSPENTDADSRPRIDHLLDRLNGDVTEGFAKFRLAEANFSDCTPRRMSVLTQRLFNSIDVESARKRRIENYRVLNDHLKTRNLRKLPEIEEDSGPLCYPFYTRDLNVRQRLLDAKIFIPTYWTDAHKRLKTISAHEFIEQLLPLPIDQRYTETEMRRIIAVLLSNERK